MRRCLLLTFIVLFICLPAFTQDKIEVISGDPPTTELLQASDPSRSTQIAISSLKIRVTTCDEPGAGTKDTVYFDIGPLAWKLKKTGHNNFGRGVDYSYELKLPPGIELSSEDILWLRLEKKGFGGFTGMPDGFGGKWMPCSIQLFINDQTDASFSFEIKQWLNRRHPVWKKEVRPFDPDTFEERFARSLRLVPNRGFSGLGGFLSNSIGILTTLLKKAGLSGWRSERVMASVVGTVIRPPNKSTDGFASIDLMVESIEIGTRLFIFDGLHGINQPRFIRAEYKHHGNPLPRNCQRVKIYGEIKWDMDQEGWYEVHPRRACHVEILL